MNAHEKVLNLLSTINKGVDLKDELQTEIDPSIYFRRNSVNLLVGKKGSGKTYNVFREVLKLKFVDNHHYTKMLYVTNKPYDPTFRRIKDLLPITVEKITYDKAVEDYIAILKKHYLTKGRTEQHLMRNYTTTRGGRYASHPYYEVELRKTYNDIARKTKIKILQDKYMKS